MAGRPFRRRGIVGHQLPHQASQDCQRRRLAALTQRDQPEAGGAAHGRVHGQFGQVRGDGANGQQHGVAVARNVHEAGQLLALQCDEPRRVGRGAIGLHQQPGHLVAQRGGGDGVALHILEAQIPLQAGEWMVGAAHEGGAHFVHDVQRKVGCGPQRAQVDDQGIEQALA